MISAILFFLLFANNIARCSIAAFAPSRPAVAAAVRTTPSSWSSNRKAFFRTTTQLDMSPIELADAAALGGLAREFFGSPDEAITELTTLSLLLLGTNSIVQFIRSEYDIITKKAKAMEETGGVRKVDFTWTELVNNRLDYYFSTSEWAKVVLLLSLTFFLFSIGTGLLVAVTPDHSISDAAWDAWTYVADPGTHADAPEGFLIRTVALSITVGGLLIFGLMIGIISDSVGEKVDGLKKGRSRVIEADHTLMLNWNDKSLAIIQQIALANESEGGGTIVVLSDQDKEEMEEKLNAAVESKEEPLGLMGTEVVFRSGNPLMENDLGRVSANTARSVIALSSAKDGPDEADANMVRQVLALKAFSDFDDKDCHVVVEVQDVDNKELFTLVAPDFAEVIVNNDMIGRLMLQCARTPGLAFVLDAMMGFEGSEFYFEEWPELVGKSFYEITCRFDDAVPIGIRSGDGKVFINPENDFIIKEGDQILVLAEDNDTYEVNDGGYSLAAGDCPGEGCPLPDAAETTEKILFCGWRRDMADMITQLDEYVQQGSELWLFSTVPAEERDELLQDKGNKEELSLKNLSILNVVGNPIIRRDLNRIRAVDSLGNPTGESITLDEFDSILILADEGVENGASSMSSDSRSLASTLIIQDIQQKLYSQKKSSSIKVKVKPPCIPVSEILDSRTKSLLGVANCKGYVMSNRIISSVMAQVSEEKGINAVLSELLSAKGSETYIREVSRYVDFEEENTMSFWDVALRARRQREVAVGYKPAAMDFKEAEHLIINPPDKALPRVWERGDSIIVFSLE